MFGAKKNRITELERCLAIGESQYNEAQQTIAELRRLLEDSGGGDLVRMEAVLTRARAEHTTQMNALAQQRQTCENNLRDLDALLHERNLTLQQADAAIAAREREIADLDMRISDGRFLTDRGLTNYTHPAHSSVQLGCELDRVRAQIKDVVKSGRATHALTSFQFNGSTSKGKKFIGDMAKMTLRSYNAEAENCMLTVKAGNGETAFKRLDRARDQVKKLGSFINLEITREYHDLRRQELSLVLQYQNAKKAEKEAEREERARLREEARAQKEFEAQRLKLTKEKSHYENVLASLEEQGRVEEASSIRAKLEEVEAEIESVDYRAANIRAGYVYVISNIGAFGEHMVKIGMTRRLEPMDRVRELGDASVPFNFDVHALFFSEDAVGVETELHRRFANRRVNRINARREFFYATPTEVRTELTSIAGNLLEFIEEPEAEQYRLSLAEAASADEAVQE